LRTFLKLFFQLRYEDAGIAAIIQWLKIQKMVLRPLIVIFDDEPVALTTRFSI
jgi:aromatic ring-cleaving dioxygenase